jgi:hypothetical protein
MTSFGDSQWIVVSRVGSAGTRHRLALLEAAPGPFGQS